MRIARRTWLAGNLPDRISRRMVRAETRSRSAACLTVSTRSIYRAGKSRAMPGLCLVKRFCSEGNVVIVRRRTVAGWRLALLSLRRLLATLLLSAFIA